MSACRIDDNGSCTLWVTAGHLSRETNSEEQGRINHPFFHTGTLKPFPISL